MGWTRQCRPGKTRHEACVWRFTNGLYDVVTVVVFEDGHLGLLHKDDQRVIYRRFVLRLHKLVVLGRTVRKCGFAFKEN